MIGDIIHKQILQEYQAEEARDYLGISQAGYCAQKLLYAKEAGHIRPQMDQRTLIRFLTGNAVHEKILSLLWRARGKDFTYRKAEKEVVRRTPEGNDWKGHLDLRARRHGREFVADLKIVGDPVFRMVLRNGAHQHYKDQVMIYADTEGTEVGVLTYVNDNTGEIKEFEVQVDPERIAYLDAKYDAIIAGNVAGYPLPESDWECGRCDYKWQCPVYAATHKLMKSEKTGEVAEIDQGDLEKEYVELKTQAEQSKARMDEIKSEIAEALPAGSNGQGQYLKATYIKPTTRVTYDKKQLEALIPAAQLEPAKKEKQASGYYKFEVWNDPTAEQ